MKEEDHGEDYRFNKMDSIISDANTAKIKRGECKVERRQKKVVGNKPLWMSVTR